MNKMIVTPLMYNLQAFHDYGVHKRTGELYSKKSGEWKKLSWQVGGNMKYPWAKLSDYGVVKCVSFHKAACETLKPVPAPVGVTESEWRVTPRTVKRAMHKVWQVNHKDHNHLNFSPNNLEWVTGIDNCRLYQEHRKKSS
jgi:hypothetical protein